jgi:Tfp pilus assembly protein PilF
VSAPSVSLPGFDRRRKLVLIILLVACTFALYAPAIRNGFVNYDDTDYVTNNPHVLQGLTRADLVWAFTGNYAGNWHPLTWISHMADVQWFGMNPAGHHLMNILWHILNVALVFLLLERATGRAFLSAVVAVLFALHPLNVESVAWVAERKSVLCMTFLLLALGAYGWYVRRPGIWRYICVAVLFALGLMSKAMVITLPFALLLLDYWPLQRMTASAEDGGSRPFIRRFLALFAEKIPLFALAAGDAWITIHAQHSTGSVGSSLALPLRWRFKNAVFSYAVYLGKVIWPAHLAVFHPHPENTLDWWKVIAAGVLLAGITALVWHFRERKYLLAGWLWYLGTMFPMIGIVQSGRQGMADRFAYIPFLGLFVAAVWSLAEWAMEVPWRRTFLQGAFALLIGVFAYAAHLQIGYWRNSYTLFSHALEVTPDNGISENNLGAALMEMGQAQLALAHFETAVRLLPQYATAHYNLGVLLQGQQHPEEAAREYRITIAQTSDPIEAAQAHNNLGILYFQDKNYAAALPELNAAIAINPAKQNSYLARGMIELQFMNFNAAIADFSRATEIAPSPLAYFWLGRALESNGGYDRATSAYAAALQLAPAMQEARARLEALRSRSVK